MKKFLSILTLTALLLTLIVMPTEAASRVDELIGTMSARQKVEQMLMMDFRVWDSDGTGAKDFTVMNDQVRQIVENYDLGAVIYFANNIKTTKDTFHLTRAMQEAAAKGENDIPLLIATDQEGGSVYRLGSGTALPGNMALGATGDASYAYEAGRIIGSELGCLGIKAALAPVVDVNNNANNPVIGLRAYSDDAQTVGNLAAESIRGMKDFGVIGCAKHFPGHGDTGTDSHYGLPVVNKPMDELLRNELLPYKIAIENGVEMIMTAHILYPKQESDTILSDKTGKEEALPATMSDDILTGILKEDFGFKGIICTDAMNMAGISENWDEVQAVKNAISAGADLICMPTHVECMEDLAGLDAVIDGVVAAVDTGEIPEARLDDACRRILTVKENRGILDENAADYSLENALQTVGCDENRAMERKMSAAAVTVLENHDDTLPLRLTAQSKVLMLTPYNNECGQLAMGWNRAREAGLIPDGAEVRIVRYSSADLAACQADLDWADTLLINSEISSVSSVKSNSWIYAAPRAFLEYGAENGKTTVIMSVDKPYDVQLYPEADAVLAVYGCKGSSVDPTEALIGGITESESACGPNITAGVEVMLGVFGAGGRLPVQIPVLDRETYTYTSEIAYERGYGLTYDPLSPDMTDKSALEKAISAAAEREEANYTSASWAQLVQALEAARGVWDDPDAAQETVDEAAAMLHAAMDALAERVNMDDLQQLTAEAEKLDLSRYTSESAAVLTSALEGARAVLENPDASADEVAAACAALQSAIDDLQLKSSDNGSKERNAGDKKNNSSESSKSAGDDSAGPAVRTGDHTPIARYISLAVLALIGMMLLRKHKKSA